MCSSDLRDIACECNITATNIYHYYKDKDSLFQSIALDCLYALNERIKEDSKKGQDIKQQIKNAVFAYRDWCFENPRRALLVMQGIKSADDAPDELIEEFYVCNRTGEKLLRQAVKEKKANSSNPRLDVGILVAGLWGCVESVLLKKSEIEHWENGKAFTDRFIKMWCDSVFVLENQNNMTNK